MFALVELYKESELKHDKFAASHGMSEQTFRRWRQRYRKECAVDNNAALEFIEIGTDYGQDTPNEPEPNQRQPKIDVELPCGTRIRIY